MLLSFASRSFLSYSTRPTLIFDTVRTRYKKPCDITNFKTIFSNIRIIRYHFSVDHRTVFFSFNTKKKPKTTINKNLWWCLVGGIGDGATGRKELSIYIYSYHLYQVTYNSWFIQTDIISIKC